MREQSILSQVPTIGPVTATPSCSMQISVTWTSSGGSSYQVNRALAAQVGIVGHPTVVIVPRTQPVASSLPHPDTLPDKQAYVYTVTVWDSRNESNSRNSNSVTGNPNRCSAIPCGFFIQSKKGSYELLFAQGTHIKHITHRRGSILTGRWKQVGTLHAPPEGTILDNAVGLIQSASGNYEAVAVVRPRQDEGHNYLVSYKFDPEYGWQGPSPVTVNGQRVTGATGTPALIQTREGPVMLFVPLGNSIGSYMHQPDSDAWTPLAPFGTSDTVMYKAISLVQTISDRLELVVRTAPTQVPQEGATDYLVSFVLNTLYPQIPVQNVGPLTADGQSINGVTGAPTFTQIDRGTFELVVPRGALMEQYIQETGSIGDNLWKHVSTLEPLKSAPGVQFTATSMIQSTSGKLELVALATPPQGQGEDFLVSYEFTGWQGPRRIVVDGHTQS